MHYCWRLNDHLRSCLYVCATKVETSVEIIVDQYLEKELVLELALLVSYQQAKSEMQIRYLTPWCELAFKGNSNFWSSVFLAHSAKK